jgi:hypothetical protein
MTLRELIAAAGERPLLLVIACALPPLVAWLMARIHGPGRGEVSPWRYAYSVLVYVACVPGLLAAVVVGYTLFFTRENLLDVDILVHLLPIVTMVATLVLIRRAVSFEQIPGFERLSSLMITIALSFGIALAIQKTRIWVFFGASIWMLFAIAAVVFVVLHWASRKVLASGGDKGS